MKTRPKDLGTAHETRIVRACQDAGLVAERIAEGGAFDVGDVRIYSEEVWVLEAKIGNQIAVHQTLDKALRKSGTPWTAVVSKKMTRLDGNQRRTQVGPVTVSISLDVFLELLKRKAI